MPAHAATVPPNMDSHFDLPLPWFGNQVHIHNLFFDPTGWDANNRFSEADINAATSALVRSGYFDGLQQYGIPHLAFDGSVNSDAVCNPLASLGATGPLWTDLLKSMACEARRRSVAWSPPLACRLRSRRPPTSTTSSFRIAGCRVPGRQHARD